MNLMRRRLKVCIRAGLTQVTSDDITDNGRITLDSSHSPNGRQSGIGSFFQQMGKEGILRKVGETVNSKAPHRKGGAIQVWEVTEKGKLWATRRIIPRQ